MRQTVNLDSERHETLEELSQHRNVSKSQVIRDAIDHYDTVARDWRHVEDEALEWYVRLLESNEHRIFDVDHIESLMDAVGLPADALHQEWRRMGHKHGIEWADQFDSVEEKLRVLEYCNWYTITAVGDKKYALTTESETEATLFSAFLEGECEELGLDVDVRQVDQKILVTDNCSG